MFDFIFRRQFDVLRSGVFVVGTQVFFFGSSCVPAEERSDAGENATRDAGGGLPPLPTTPLDVRVGELSILQLHLSPGLTLRMGESAIVVGPDGTMVLIDVGASRHADEIFDVVTALNRDVLTPANGFVARSEREVDFMVFTHFHGDHVGGAEDLLSGSLALDVTHGIVHRGFTDLGGSVNENDVKFLCNTLTSGEFAARNLALCFADPAAPCAASSWETATSPAYPTQSCALLAGDLRTTSDDAAGVPSFIPLGEGAKLVFLASSSHVSDGQSIHPFPDVMPVVDTNHENARSLVGVIEYGAFRYHFGGDLTGKGAEEAPDVESHVVQYAHDRHGDDGIGVTHVHHHAHNTSSNQYFVDWVTPIDGKDRNVVAGLNSGYMGAPKAGEVERFTDDNRLAEGKFWVTKWARVGSAGETVVDADGDVLVQTFSQGEGHFLQAVSQVPPICGRFRSVRTSSSR
ncbi:MAG: MBL fold metallo-hydrolase [Deltaproteobacteria bacterium]|nr:MBL fold metallo-hydrolase [Deltaproteobacteria bacterium]